MDQIAQSSQPPVNPSVTGSQPVANNVPPATKKPFPKKLALMVLGAIALILVIVLVVSMLFNNSSKKSTSGEIVWWGLWEEDGVIQSIIDDYKTVNPNVTIKYVKQSKEDYRERLTNALAKGTGPDIFRFHNTWVPMFKSELDKVPTNVYSPSEFALTFYPVAVSDLTVNSSLVGIPLEYDGLSLYINEEIFEKSGKSIPLTWNELRQTARELTVKDEKGSITQAGVALGRTENVDHWPEILSLMMLQNGVDMTDPAACFNTPGKEVDSNSQTCLGTDALEFYTIFSAIDGVWDTTLPSSTVAFASGKLAMYFGPSWRAFEIRLQNPNLRFKTVPVPQLPKTSANEADVTYASYWVEGVWARSTKKQAAWEFLKYLSSKEVMEKFYNEASRVRMFGEPYSRMDMADLLQDHPIIGSTISQAKSAQTWFLQSRTWDGPTGINSQINKYFEDAINATNDRTEASVALTPVSSGVIQVLSQYGIRVK